MAQHRRESLLSRFRTVISLCAACIIAVGLVAGGINVVTTHDTSESNSAVTPMNQTLIADVVRVESPTIVTARAVNNNTEIRVSVIGIQDPPSCAYESSWTFARSRIEGQRVTLVPDPALPGHTRDGMSYFHVVLSTQLSYSDAALMSGNALVAPYESTYRNVYVREENEARDREIGLWSTLCSESERSESLNTPERDSSSNGSTVTTSPSTSTTR